MIGHSAKRVKPTVVPFQPLRDNLVQLPAIIAVKKDWFPGIPTHYDVVNTSVDVNPRSFA